MYSCVLCTTLNIFFKQNIQLPYWHKQGLVSMRVMLKYLLDHFSNMICTV